jgi:GNAT superfamily N-acetyltransferase
MLIVADVDRIVGGAFGFRRGDGVTLRMIGLEQEYRGFGLGRRLIQAIEVEAMHLGARSISLGANEVSKGFYMALGYRGKSSMHKDLPLPSRVLDARLERLTAALGDLEVGQCVTPTSGSDRVPTLL